MTVHSSNLVFSREGLKHGSKEIPYLIIKNENLAQGIGGWA